MRSVDPPVPASRVLVADDDPTIGDVVPCHFEAAGLAVSLCYDGAAAPAAVDRTRPDVVVDLMSKPGRSERAGDCEAETIDTPFGLERCRSSPARPSVIT